MRLGLDARTIYWPTRRGTGRNLIDLYRGVAQARPDWRVTAYHRLSGDVPSLLPSPQVEPRYMDMPGDRFEAWGRWRLPMAAWRDGVDLLHCPANHCPSIMPCPTLVTIHDLIPLDMPDSLPAAQVRRFEQSVVTACRKAAGIVCPSQYTANRLIEEFDADPSRLTVNAWAADSSMELAPPEDWEPVLQRYRIDGHFVLHFGASDPRKNTRGMIQAWAMLPRQTRRHWKLLVVGLNDRAKADLTEMVSRLGLQSSVDLHGFAADAHLPVLLSAASVLAYPSLSEGFGLPILDAWATEAAVLCSNTTSLPEVAGDAAVQVDPAEPHAIAKGLARLLNDPILRGQLVQRGKQRLEQYSWDHTVRRFLGAVERAAGGQNLQLAQAA
jgi:glycosyltransferase involved in cell wall biosynthesis